MRDPRFKIFRLEQDGMWYWQLQSKNGKVLCQGEGHTRRADVYRAVETVVDAVVRASTTEEE